MKKAFKRGDKVKLKGTEKLMIVEGNIPSQPSFQNYLSESKIRCSWLENDIKKFGEFEIEKLESLE